MFQRKEVIGKERVAHDKKFSSREASSCSSSSGFGSLSTTSNYSSTSTETNTNTKRNSHQESRIKFATESAIFNFEKESFSFGNSEELSLSSIAGKKTDDKDFFCWFGPSGSVPRSCAKCKTLVQEKFVTTGDLVYHPRCFRCSVCQVVLGSGCQFEHEGIFYCKKDYLELFAEKCSKCSRPLEEEYTHVDGKQFHFRCFTCKKCNRKLDSYREKDGDYYCDKDFRDLFSPKCSKCKKQCRQKFYRTSGGDVFHHECFICCGCGKRMTKHFVIGGKYYCSESCGNGTQRRLPTGTRK